LTKSFRDEGLHDAAGELCEGISEQLFRGGIGDDNFSVSGVPVKSGLLKFSTNSTVAWTSGRHEGYYKSDFWMTSRDFCFGEIGLADGSVERVTQDRLRQAFQQTGVATNRLAIP